MPGRTRRTCLAALGVTGLASLSGCSRDDLLIPRSEEIEAVEANPAAGFRLPYALYKPAIALDDVPPFAEPPNGPH